MGRVRLTGASGSRVNTPDVAALSFTGDLDVRALMSADDWTPAGLACALSHWATGGNQRSWDFGLASSPSGRLYFGWSANGTATTFVTSTVTTGRTDGLHLWIRVVHDVDNGAAGNDTLFYTSTDPITTAPASVSWTQLGTTITTAGTTSHHDSTTNIATGAASAGTIERWLGYVYYAELRDASATIQASPDFRDGAQTADGGLTFTDPQTRVWTVQTPAFWVNEGTGASTLAGVTSAGTGVYGSVTGTGASTLAGVTSAGSGTYTPGTITGTGTSTLAGVTSAGVGVATGMGPIPRQGCCGGRRRCCRRDRVSA